MKQLSILLFAVVILGGCQMNAKQENNPLLPQNWFKLEVERLEKNVNVCLRKTVQMNAKVDTVLVNEPLWNKELEVFSGIELKALALEQQFDQKDSAGWKVFTANDPKQTVRKMSLQMKEGKVLQWFVHIVSQDKIRSGNRKLTYEVGEGYEIRGSQSIRLYGQEEFHIIGRFVDCSPR